MPLPPELRSNWNGLSQLLDEALALPPESRAAFVDSLSGVRPELRDILRQLLAHAAGVDSSDFMATLPQFKLAAARDALADLASGDTIGSYRLLREIGTGGMGSVWLAERADGTLKRKVALKLPRLTWVKGLGERMERERDILGSLEHPHIARLYDAGVDHIGRPFLTLEYVEGQPIDSYARDHRLTVQQKLELLLQVCGAVAFAHSRLVVHRDLKPSNILITDDGQARLLDFGIAKLLEGESASETQLTQLAGRALTLDYASPEQIRGEPIGTQSDVYSLGVVAYELLCGVRPYKLVRGSAAELEEAIANVDAPRASGATMDPVARKALRGDLDAILHKALQKSPTQRYGTVDALAQDLRRHLNNEPVSAQSESWTYRAGKFLRRYRLQVTAGSVVVAAVLAGTVAALIQTRQAQRAAEQERIAREAADMQMLRAQAVKDFLIQLFSSNDVNARSAEQRRLISAEQLLQDGARRINEGFKEQPELRAELQGVVGRLLYDLRLLEHAAPALQERAEYLERTLASPAERSAAWLALARLRYGQSDLPGLRDGLARAIEAGEKAQTPQDWLAYWAAVSEYGAHLDVQGKPDEARPYLKGAVDGLRAVAPQSPEFALALESYASLLIDQGAHDDALPMLTQALSLYETLHGSQPVDLARVYIRYGGNLLGVDDAKAERLTRQGLQMMSQHVGADHPSTARGVLRLSQLLIKRGEPQEARPLLDALLAASVASSKSFSKDIPSQASRFLGEASLAEGRLSEAVDWTSRYIATADSDITRALAHDLMFRVRVDTGDYGAAASELKQAHTLFAAISAPDHAIFTSLKVLEAELLSRTGDVEGARRSLLRVLNREGRPAEQSAINAARLVLANIALAMEEPAEALAVLGSTYERFGNLPVEQRGRIREIEIIVPLARALIGVGRVHEARPLVERANALAEPLYANGPLRLKVEALAVRLEMAQGRVDSARARARIARARIRAEPQVAPHHLRLLDGAERQRVLPNS